MTRLILIVLFFFSLTALAQKKISELPSLTESQFATGDLFTIVDISGSGTTKKTTVGDLDLRYFRNISILGTASGGTGVASYTDGDLLIGSGGGLIKLPRGVQNGQVLTTSGTSLAWANPASGTAASGTTDTKPVIYYKTSAQTIPNASATIINFDVVVRDNSGEVTTGANWRFTPSSSGTYLIDAAIQFASANYGLNVIFETNLFKKGANPLSLDYKTHQNGAATQAPTLNGSTTVQLDPSLGDYIDVRAYQNSGGPQPLVTGEQYNRISIMKIGPL